MAGKASATAAKAAPRVKKPRKPDSKVYLIEVPNLKERQDAQRFMRQAGPLLYGPDWQKPLADALGVSARLVGFWLAGKPLPPADLRDQMRRVFRTRERAQVDNLNKLRALFGGQGDAAGDD